jgi:hypothetical protein
MFCDFAEAFISVIFNVLKIDPIMGYMGMQAWVYGSVVVKALCYKPEGRGFGSR